MASDPKEVKAAASSSDVHLVLANGNHIPAKVTKRYPGKLVDLEAQHRGETLVITSSPLDETGKKPDSWHLPEEVPAAATDAPPAK